MLSCIFACSDICVPKSDAARFGGVLSFGNSVKRNPARIQIVSEGARESLLYNQSHSESKNYRLEVACCLSRSFLREYLYCDRGLLCCNSTENVRLLRTEGILG